MHNFSRRFGPSTAPKRRGLRSQTAMPLVLGAVALVGTAGTAAAQEDTDKGNEIIVTATKRETTLQDTPLAISVVGGDQIEKRNLVGMEDYLASMPGVSYQDRGTGSNTITIRGIALGSQLDPNSPVGSYFGEVPVTGLGSAVNGNQAGNSDIKMVDVSRVEVLRGPQGTLYGSGSMGGTVRVIPNAPDLQGWGGDVKAQLSHTARLGGLNYSVEGVVNIPIVNDQLALRIVGYRFFNEGWIDNVAASRPTVPLLAAQSVGAVLRDRKNIGGDETTGVRASALWRPLEGLSVTATYLNQWLKQDGIREVEPGLGGDYRQARPAVGVNGNDDEFVDMQIELANLVVEYDMGFGTLLNSTSILGTESKSDLSLSFNAPIFVGVGSRNNKQQDVFINELRFASDWGGPLAVIAGLYYEKRKARTVRAIRWNGNGPVPPGRLVQNDDVSNQQKQYAAFGEASFTPWDPLTLTVGARYFKFDQTILQAYVNGAPYGPVRNAKTDGVNWKVNLSYKASDEIFVYGQWAQGFREPRFQTLVQRVGANIDPLYDVDQDGLIEFADGVERKVTEGLLNPDTVDNYEIGIKFQSGRLRGSLTGFYVDWIGIPLVPSLTTYGGAGYYFNAGKAVSKGIEFELSGEIHDGLFAEFSTSWVSAKLVEGARELGVVTGGQPNLPGSADHNIKAALEKRFKVSGYDAFVRGDWSYISQYYGLLQETGIPSGDYHLFDASAGITIDNFKIGLFAKNLTNGKDFTWVDNVFVTGRSYRLRPRTIGLNLGVAF